MNPLERAAKRIEDLATDFERDARIGSLGQEEHPSTAPFLDGMREAAKVVRELPRPTLDETADALDKALDDFAIHAHVAVEFSNYVDKGPVHAAIDAHVAAVVAEQAG